MKALLSRPMSSINIEEITNIVFSESPCTTCDDPCHTHENMPATMVKKIDQSNLYQTFKPYTQHILIPGGSHDTWDHDVLEFQDSYCSKGQEYMSKSSNGRIIITAYETGTPQVTIKETLVQPVYLLPQGLKFPRINQQKFELMANWLATGGQHSDAPIDSIPIEYSTIILVCAHQKRDKKCGIAGPLLIKEFQSQIEAKEISSILVLPVSHIGGRFKLIRTQICRKYNYISP